MIRVIERILSLEKWKLKRHRRYIVLWIAAVKVLASVVEFSVYAQVSKIKRWGHCQFGSRNDDCC